MIHILNMCYLNFEKCKVKYTISQENITKNYIVRGTLQLKYLLIDMAVVFMFNMLKRILHKLKRNYLVVFFATFKFYLYFYGRKIFVSTARKPLVSLIKKNVPQKNRFVILFSMFTVQLTEL